jgi:hypothetical protein
MNEIDVNYLKEAEGRNCLITTEMQRVEIALLPPRGRGIN